MARYDIYKQHKTCKETIDEELMPVAWHPTKAWNWCKCHNGANVRGNVTRFKKMK